MLFVSWKSFLAQKCAIVPLNFAIFHNPVILVQDNLKSDLPDKMSNTGLRFPKMSESILTATKNVASILKHSALQVNLVFISLRPSWLKRPNEAIVLARPSLAIAVAVIYQL